MNSPTDTRSFPNSWPQPCTYESRNDRRNGSQLISNSSSLRNRVTFHQMELKELHPLQHWLELCSFIFLLCFRFCGYNGDCIRSRLTNRSWWKILSLSSCKSQMPMLDPLSQSLRRFAVLQHDTGWPEGYIS